MDNNGVLNFFIEIFLTGISVGWWGALASYAIILPYIVGTKRGWKSGFRAMFIFCFGRLIAYVALGALAGFSGTYITHFFYESTLKYYVEIYGGIFVLVMGLSIIVAGIKSWRFFAFLHRWDQIFIFLIGVFVGIIPGVSFLAILSYLVLNTNSYILGSIGGFIFGLGTLITPFLLVGGFLGYLTDFIRSERLYAFIQKISGALVVYLALKIIFTAVFMLRS